MQGDTVVPLTFSFASVRALDSERGDLTSNPPHSARNLAGLSWANRSQPNVPHRVVVRIQTEGWCNELLGGKVGYTNDDDNVSSTCVLITRIQVDKCNRWMSVVPFSFCYMIHTS